MARCGAPVAADKAARFIPFTTPLRRDPPPPQIKMFTSFMKFCAAKVSEVLVIYSPTYTEPGWYMVT